MVQEFSSVGGGGVSPQLILQKSNGQFQRNLSFFKAPDGVQFFPGGQTFSRGCPIAYSL